MTVPPCPRRRRAVQCGTYTCTYRTARRPVYTGVGSEKTTGKHKVREVPTQRGALRTHAWDAHHTTHRAWLTSRLQPRCLHPRGLAGGGGPPVASVRRRAAARGGAGAWRERPSLLPRERKRGAPPSTDGSAAAVSPSASGGHHRRRACVGDGGSGDAGSGAAAGAYVQQGGVGAGPPAAATSFTTGDRACTPTARAASSRARVGSSSPWAAQLTVAHGARRCGKRFRGAWKRANHSERVRRQRRGVCWHHCAR